MDGTKEMKKLKMTSHVATPNPGIQRDTLPSTLRKSIMAIVQILQARF